LEQVINRINKVKSCGDSPQLFFYHTNAEDEALIHFRNHWHILLILNRAQQDAMVLTKFPKIMLELVSSALGKQWHACEPLECPDKTMHIAHIGRALHLNAEIDLHQQFAIDRINNTANGFNRLLDLAPDLILYVCQSLTAADFNSLKTIKRNRTSSHIPIALIVAHVSKTEQINCFNIGINAIMLSTTDGGIINAQLKALINEREKLRNYYRPSTDYKQPDDNKSYDELFIARAQKVVFDNYTNSDFNIEQFVKHMKVSRTMLYVKIKSLTNKTTSEFVRDIRLEEAARILKQGELNVSEVAFKVGFRDPKYLSKKFKQKFQICPSDFRRG